MSETSRSVSQGGDQSSDDVVGGADDLGQVFAQHYWEYEDTDDAVSVKGRLAKSVRFWEKVVQASSFVVDVISSGYVKAFYLRTY